MQIMPKTGEWIAELLGVSEFQKEDLFDPDLNIRFGCCYLAYLSDLFSEEWQIVASYNAGEGQVKEWVAEGISQDTIPFAETKGYCRKVFKAKAYYKHKKFVGFD